MLTGIKNLSLYFSADKDNVDEAKRLRQDYDVKLAWLADTFEEASSQVRALTGKPGAKCPEQTRQIPLISKDGGACYTCGLCTTNKTKTDIRFSISKK
jgi:hypothetical protein